jgi:hypothetical protein
MSFNIGNVAKQYDFKIQINDTIQCNISNIFIKIKKIDKYIQ